MTTERDHARDQDRGVADHTDHDVAPGRASKSGYLRAPDAPLISGILMRKASGTSAADPESAVAAATGSSGNSLPDELRARFEGSLGTDLSSVRVHTESSSHAATEAVGAHAYALGNDIHFAAGQYDPHSERGQHLIAHEVAHTVQQRGGSAVRQNKLAMSTPGDSSEVEADRAAVAMVAGTPVAISGASTMGRMIQREAAAPPASGPTVGANASASNTSIDVTVSGGVQKSFPLKHGDLELRATVAVKGKLEHPPIKKDAGEVEVSGGHNSSGESKGGTEGTVPGDKVELYKRATAKKAEEASEKSLLSDYEVTGVELETAGKAAVEGGKGKESKAGGSYSIGATLKVSFKNAKPASVAATLIGLQTENGKPSMIAPSISMTIPGMEVELGKQDFGGGWSFTGTYSMGGSVTFTPKFTKELMEYATKKIFGEAAKAGAKEVAKDVAVDAAEGAAEGAAENGAAALDLAAIGEVVGFGAIAVAMGYAFVSGASSVEAIKDYVRRGRAATESYVVGALSVMGMAQGASTDPMFFIKGMSDYSAKVSAMVAAVKGKPELAKFTISDAEIRTAILTKLKASGDEVRSKIWGAAEPAIAKAFAEDYYKQKQGWIFKTEDRRDAERVAAGLGQPQVRVGEDGVATEVENK